MSTKRKQPSVVELNTNMIGKKRARDGSDVDTDEDDSGPEELGSRKHQRFNSEDDGNSQGESSGDDSNNSAGSMRSSEQFEEELLEQQVADLPFEVLEQLQQDGQGLKGKAAKLAAAAVKDKKFKRLNRHRPSEMSSKRPVPRFREVIQAPKREARDPRFDSISGNYDKDIFRKRYSFLYEDVMPEERRKLKERLKKEKSPQVKQELQSQLTRVEQQIRDEEMRRKTKQLEDSWKAQEKQAVAGGKRPFYLKASDKKKLALQAKYEELKQKGKLDKYMEKRRRVNAQKDHRYVPTGRRAAQG